MLYIKPPRGDILLNELHDCVTTRINYFLHHYRQESTISKDFIKFEYLTLGTALDRTGHFMLRLLSAQSESLKEFVLSSEAAFIIERLEFLASKQILQLITTTLRHVNEGGSNTVWTTEINYIFTQMKCAFKSMHMINFKHDENCMLYNLKVPFQMCLSLVAKREFKMERGQAVVPCGKWKLFLKCLFEAHMRREMMQIQSNDSVLESMADHRLQELKDVVFNIFVRNSINGRPTTSETNINAGQVHRLGEIFPPCMGHLYSNLKVTHRLSHHARFNFSLFLKDIGMPLNESIAFWRAEYSKPVKCVGKCAHSWQKDSGKYTYGIRHMYGLEGRQANYCVPSCRKIQSNNLGPVEEGGCPFLNFDLKRLQSLLDQKVIQNTGEFEKIIQLRSQGQALAACDYYRKALVNVNVVKRDIVNTETDTKRHKTPVEYFLILNKYLNLEVR